MTGLQGVLCGRLGNEKAPVLGCYSLYIQYNRVFGMTIYLGISCKPCFLGSCRKLQFVPLLLNFSQSETVVGHITFGYVPNDICNMYFLSHITLCRRMFIFFTTYKPLSTIKQSYKQSLLFGAPFVSRVLGVSRGGVFRSSVRLSKSREYSQFTNHSTILHLARGDRCCRLISFCTHSGQLA